MPNQTHVWPFQSQATKVAGRMSAAWARMQGLLCEPQPWEMQVAEWTLPSVTDYVNVSDGNFHYFNFTDPTGGQVLNNFPPGQYYVKYCRGAWVDEVEPPPATDAWAVAKEDPSQPQLNGGNRIFAVYNNNGTQTQATFNEQDQIYTSYGNANAGATGTATLLFNHAGGNIQMGFIDLPVQDNQNAQDASGAVKNTAWVNPTYMLLQARPWFTVGLVRAFYTQDNSPRWTGYFDIGNMSPWAWNNITIKLRDVAGLVTNATPVVVNFGANGTQTVAVTFDCPTSKCDPIIEVWWNGAVYQDFQIHLAALISWDRATPYQSTGGLACGRCIWIYAVFSNLGNMDTTRACKFEVKALSGFTNPMQPPDCTPGGTDYILTQLCCQYHQGCPYYNEFDYYFAYVNPKPAAKLEAVVSDGGTVLLDRTTNV